MLPHKLLDSSSGVKAFSRPLETPKKHGVLVSGYGYPAESFRYIFLELMDHLASCGVDIANDPSEFKPVSGDAASLNFLIEESAKIGAESLLYVKVEHGWSNIHRLKLECFDTKGALLWEESASSSTSWATSEGGRRGPLSSGLRKNSLPASGNPAFHLRRACGGTLPLVNHQNSRREAVEIMRHKLRNEWQSSG